MAHHTRKSAHSNWSGWADRPTDFPGFAHHCTHTHLPLPNVFSSSWVLDSGYIFFRLDIYVINLTKISCLMASTDLGRQSYIYIYFFRCYAPWLWPEYTLLYTKICTGTGQHGRMIVLVWCKSPYLIFADTKESLILRFLLKAATIVLWKM